jgi:hypothetical protein
VQKQGGEVVDLVQKTFREFTIADEEPHFQGGRASLTCDLLLAAFSKQIHSKTRVHTQGLSPSLSQINPSQNTHSNSGTVPEFSVPEFSVRLHSAIGYITPADCLAELSEVIGKERDRKLEAARKLRQEKRAATKQVA